MYSASQTTKFPDQCRTHLSQGSTLEKDQLWHFLQPLLDSDDKGFAHHPREEVVIVPSPSQVSELEDLLHVEPLTTEFLDRTLDHKSLTLPFTHWVWRLFQYTSPSLKILLDGMHTLRGGLSKPEDLPQDELLELNPFTQWILRGSDAGSMDAVIDQILKPIYDATNLDDIVGTLERLISLEEHYTKCKSLLEWCTTIYDLLARLDMGSVVLSLNKAVLNLMQSMSLRELTEGRGRIEQELNSQWRNLYEHVKHRTRNSSDRQVAYYFSLAEGLYQSKNYHSLSAVINAMNDSGNHTLQPEFKAFHDCNDKPFGWNETPALLWMRSVRAYINRSAQAEWKHNIILTFISKIFLYGKITASKPRTLSPAQSQSQLTAGNVPTGIRSLPAPLTSGFEQSDLRLSLFPSPPLSSRPSVTISRDQSTLRTGRLNCSLPDSQTPIAPLVSTDENYSCEPGKSAASQSIGNSVEKAETDVRSTFSTGSSAESAPKLCLKISKVWNRIRSSFRVRGGE